jgi:ribosomal protein S18 acetylase RimI-like enzyme
LQHRGFDGVNEAEKYVSYLYDTFPGRVPIGVGLSRSKVYPLVFTDGKGYARGIIGIAEDGDETDMVRLHHISAFETGQGHGSTMLQYLCDLADERSVRILVHPDVLSGHENNAMTATQLRKWYEAHGFEPRGVLIRDPK